MSAGSAAKSANVDAAPEPTLPAVLVPSDPATSLDEVQTAEWQRLEREFVADLDAAGMDPRDPAYHRRWRSAQEISDAKFRQKFGTVAFLRYQMAATRAQASPQ